MNKTRIMGSVVALAITAAGANAGTILFQSRLADHPDGTANPPPYGLRIDNIFQKKNDGSNLAGGAGGIVTFSFSAAGAAVFTDVIDDTNDGQADRIRIYGKAYGGRDTGSGYANVGAGFYQIDFTYNVGVQTVNNLADGGWKVADGATRSQNNGSIRALDGSFAGETWNFSDKADNTGFSFNFLKNGHRLTGAEQLALGDPHVGEGWVQLDNGVMGTQDWLFTTVVIPMPTPAMMASAGLLGLAGIRRRRMA